MFTSDVHHRFLRYRIPGQSGSLVGLVNEANQTVSSVLQPSTGTAYSSLFDLIEDYPEVQSDLEFILVAGSETSLDKVEKLAPLVGRDILCVGKNYVEHAKEFNQSGFDGSDTKDQPDLPVIFTKRATSIIPDGHPIYTHPSVTSSLDYEGELGIIIGKGGISIRKKDAWKHVWGAVIINDVTARERQRDHRQFYIGKSLDTFAPMGAFVIPSSSLSFPDLHLTTKVNGVVRQSQNTSELIFDVPTLVETLSMGISLQGGDIIATGTPYGTGMSTTPKSWLQEGDVVEISIPPLGTLTSPVTASLPLQSSQPLAKVKTTLHVEITGPETAPVVLFIHGLGSSSQYFKPAIESAGLGEYRRVVLFDFEGHGQSTLSTGPLSVQGFVEDIERIIGKLGIIKLNIVASGTGCVIATAFAAKLPTVVQTLLLLDPVLPLDESSKLTLRENAKTARAHGLTHIAQTTNVNSTNVLTKSFIQTLITSTPVEGYALGCLALVDYDESENAELQAEIVVEVVGEDASEAGFYSDSKLLRVEGAGTGWCALEDVEGIARIFREEL